MPLAVSPIPPRPHLGTEVYQALKRHVAQLSLATSTPVHLREEDLARGFGVSRTPVREALRQLAREGLVTLSPNKGAKVFPLSLEEYLNWLDVREMLEGMAARLMAVKIGDAGIAALRDLFSVFSAGEIQAFGDPYARANAEFHARLIRMAGNPVLLRVWEMYDHMGMVELRLIERTERGKRSLREHHAIIDALERADPEAAERLARAHIRSLKDCVEERLTTIREGL